jgi:hypothetical protein
MEKNNWNDLSMSLWSHVYDSIVEFSWLSSCRIDKFQQRLEPPECVKATSPNFLFFVCVCGVVCDLPAHLYSYVNDDVKES